MSKSKSFSQSERYLPTNEKEHALIKAFASLNDENLVASFLRDLMTPAEITEFSNRLEIARQLLEGKAYLTIAKDVGTSTTTVTRVAHWLYNGCGGYQHVFKDLIAEK